MNASTALRAARADKGWSQRELARRCGVAQPSLSDIESGERDTTVGKLDQILRAAGYRLVAIPTTRPTVADWAVALASSLIHDPGAVEKSIVQVADDLASSKPSACIASCITPPPPTGSVAIDAVLAGLVEHVLASRGLPVPAWVVDDCRRSDEPWDLVDLPGLRQIARDDTPEPFRRRNVFVPADLLASV